MFDSIGLPELAVIGTIALIVVGPKQLPGLMRKAGQWTARLRGMAADFRANFDEMARQSELDELRKEVEALRNQNPLQEIKDELTKPFETGIDPYAPIMPYGSSEPPKIAEHSPSKEAINTTAKPDAPQPKRVRKARHAEVEPMLAHEPVLEPAPTLKKGRTPRLTNNPEAKAS
ncbi:Sec-independent protein translocase protein TatB [Candidatus Phycosocius spiralis]|uniref:Sec-independent protein translocase protein TatB n=1 Tax=Candidatus Phycosocius spiralis TaxID=2815099 RepID=A0ABQ4PWT2_9PROT|nr:Sec-independent protein translocase protein TatB [Candidatus Phycosocius spiralis]GIU67532.1 Sec-independent protein translocase protein TatB [Candidatus Phycosocius spiralis]